MEILDLFPRQGQWTEADYLALPETNRIIELSEGRVMIPDMPTTAHQRAVVKLLRLMSDHVEAKGLGEVCVAPLRVRLWPGKFREPDILFMHRNHADRIGEENWGIPDLVVEVISPRTPQSSGTEQVDREEKFVKYARAGVEIYKGYWISSYAADRSNYWFLSQIQRQTSPLGVRIAENIDGVRLADGTRVAT